MNAARVVAAVVVVACGGGGSSGGGSGGSTRPSASVVQTRTFHSKALGVDKDYLVYLPAGYDATPDARWPVFYYLHGLTGNETNWVKKGKLDEIADRVHLDAIVVMPDGDDSFYVDAVAGADYDYARCLEDGSGLMVPVAPKWLAKTCVRHRAYETYVVDDLLADVDGHFRTIASRDGRAIAGLSMGGFGALVLAMRHPDKFAAAASHSGIDALLAPGENDVSARIAVLGPVGEGAKQLFGTDIANWRAHDPVALADKLVSGKPAIYIDCGSEDDLHLDATAHALHAKLGARGIEHAFYIGPGHHDFAFWSARLPESLAFLRAHVVKRT